MSQMPFKEVFVASTSTLLPQGKTVDNIAVGQIGVLDAKNYKATVAPTYGLNKALYLVWGTPDLGDASNNVGFGIPNQNIYTKLIKGKNITKFSGRKSKRGKNQLVTVGWSGDVADTNSLFANIGETKRLYVTLTGSAIDKAFSTQGITRQYFYQSRIANDCTDVCGTVDPTQISHNLLQQIAQDSTVNKYFRVKELVNCNPALPAPTTQTVYKFDLTIPDTADYSALAQVQAQAPNSVVQRISTSGIYSTYEIISTTNTAPAAFSNAGIVSIPDCTTCPSGYTLSPSGYVYTVSRSDAGNAAALTTVKSDYGITGTEIGNRIAYDYGNSSYVLVSTTALTAVTGDTLVGLGTARNSCVLTSPTTTAYTAAGTQIQYAKNVTITLKDDICGNNRLADLQAAYPTYVISIVNATGTCAHTYQTTIYSNPVDATCGIDNAQFNKPNAFEGAQWLPVADAAIPAGTTCLTGLSFEAAIVNRTTNACTYDYFPVEYDTVFISVSSQDPNYHGDPSTQAHEWAVKQIQGFQYPIGKGNWVMKQEQEALGYHLKDRSFDPVVRQNEGYGFISRQDTYYDEYVLDFSFSYFVGGWSQKYVDNYKVHVFFPEGTGKAFEATINGYLASAAVEVDAVYL